MTKALREHSLLLPAELQWLVRLRWWAAAAVLAGAIAHALWTGWTAPHVWTITLGVAILLYNAAFLSIASAARGKVSGTFLLGIAGSQILLDLLALTLLTLWTGGTASPLRGLFVLHMVFASLLLPPLISYGVAALAIGLMLGSLALAGQFPTEIPALLLAGGWMAMLLLTVFLTGHITSQLRRRETERHDQQQRIQSILDTASDGIVTIDDHGTIQSANPATARIFGYGVSDLVGRNVNTLMAEPHRGDHDSHLTRYLQSGRTNGVGFSREILGQRTNGEVFPIELAVSEVPVQGGRVFTGIIRDISDRKRREREMEALNEKLIRQQQALFQNEKMAAMGQMAAGIAHEIANPIASMDSVLQLAKRRDGELRNGMIGALQEQVGRIERIVRELTAFAHPKGHEWRKVPIQQLVSDTLHMLRFERRMRLVQLKCECDGASGDVHVLPQAMQQVLVNIILNALDAMEDIASPQLTIRTRREDPWRIIEISDNGHGIEPRDVDRIFEPFFTTKPPGRGTGLGLSISANLVQRQGGSCEVESRPGSGTTFRIRLPGAEAYSGARAELSGKSTAQDW